jgi:hypothetical protein
MTEFLKFSGHLSQHQSDGATTAHHREGDIGFISSKKKLGYSLRYHRKKYRPPTPMASIKYDNPNQKNAHVDASVDAVFKDSRRWIRESVRLTLNQEQESAAPTDEITKISLATKRLLQPNSSFGSAKRFGSNGFLDVQVQAGLV